MTEQTLDHHYCAYGEFHESLYRRCRADSPNIGLIRRKRRRFSPSEREKSFNLELDVLPDDLVTYIFNFLSVKEKSRYSSVNKQWRGWSLGSMLNHKSTSGARCIGTVRSRRTCDISTKYLETMVHYCPRLRYLDLSQCSVALKPLLKLVATAKKLEYMSVADIHSSPMDVLASNADYDQRYQPYRILKLSRNVHSVLDALNRHCSEIRMICLS
eukprot:70807_1